MAPWQETVAVQDFGPAYDRYGSSASRRCALDACGMSAMPPIPTELMRHNEMSRGANRVLMQRSKPHVFDHLVGAREHASGIVRPSPWRS